MELCSRKWKALQLRASYAHGGTMGRFLKTTVTKEGESCGTFKKLSASARGTASQVQIPECQAPRESPMNLDPPAAASFSQAPTECSVETKQKLKQGGGSRAAPRVTETGFCQGRGHLSQNI